MSEWFKTVYLRRKMRFIDFVVLVMLAWSVGMAFMGLRMHDRIIMLERDVRSLEFFHRKVSDKEKDIIQDLTRLFGKK